MKKLTPTICTSLQCTPPRDHCRHCSHAYFVGCSVINGRVYRWQHNPQFGPNFQARKRKHDYGWAYDWIPNARHPVWDAYEAWEKRKFGKRKPCNQ